MSRHDLIVIGASAGGVPTLRALAAGLPRSLPAAVCVAVHVPAELPRSFLPQMLNQVGPLPAAHAEDGEPVRPGRIYVAPPDRHLLIREGHLHLTRGPRENGQRPSLDALFRTAAASYGPRVVGVILSGVLDDGTAGLLAIERAGGATVVQDPEDALYPSMPRYAAEYVRVDHVVPIAGMADLLVGLAGRARGAAAPEPGPVQEAPPREAPSEFSCPECHGVLWAAHEGELLQFRCRTGHLFSAETLLELQSRDVENTLYASLRSLEERESLAKLLLERVRERRAHDWQVRRHAAQVEEARRQADAVRRLLEDFTPGGEA